MLTSSPIPCANPAQSVVAMIYARASAFNYSGTLTPAAGSPVTSTNSSFTVSTGQSYTYAGSDCSISQTISVPNPTLPAAPAPPVLAVDSINNAIVVSYGPPSVLTDTILSYVVAVSTDGVNFQKTTSVKTTLSIPYKYGMTYTIKVAAISCSGPGALSTTSSITAAVTPNTPVIGTATPGYI